MDIDADLFDWPVKAAEPATWDVEGRLRRDLVDMIRQVKRLRARLDYLEDQNRQLRRAPRRLVLASEPPKR